MKTPKEVFYQKLNELNLSELQKTEIKIIALEFANEAWKAGFERSQDITAQTLGIFITPKDVEVKDAKVIDPNCG